VDLIEEHNRRAWDRRAQGAERFARPARDDEFQSPLQLLDPRGWLGDLTGKRLLCLAAGGGKHSVLYAAAGARVTVVDLSPRMLALDRQVAAARKLHVETIEASMTDLSALPQAGFDVVVQPVSTCYVPDVQRVYREVARVIVPGGLYISQHKQPGSLQADVQPSARGYELIEPYYREGPLPEVAGSLHRESGTLEFLHRWEELLGGLCRCGFVIEDLVEPHHADPTALPGTFKHRSCFVAPYVRIKARRTDAGVVSHEPRSLRVWHWDG
jgi:SAM-dependent methyltransferase